MSKTRLDRLGKASVSALRHQELVELARVHSPSQVKKQARAAGWPPRQIKAVTALATIRRDFGEQAFEEALSVTTERARPGDTGAEQARDNRRERAVKVIDRIKSPGAKLRLLIKRRFVDEVRDVVQDLARDYRVVFTSGYQGEVLLDSLEGVEVPPIVQMEDEGAVAAARDHRERVVMAFFSSGEGSPVAVLDFEGLRAFLGWDSRQTEAFLLPVLSNLANEEPQDIAQGDLRAIAAVGRRYLPPACREAIDLEVWLLRSHLRTGRLFELRRVVFPTPAEENKAGEEDELDVIVDRFVELGWDMDQVKAEFMVLIKSVVDSCRPQFMLALAGAKCFTYEDRQRGELGEILRERYRPGLWNDLVRARGGFFPEMYYRLSRCGLNRFTNHEDRAFHREKLLELLSEGQLARTWQLIVTLGSTLLFYAELQSATFREARKYLLGLVPEAFGRAHDLGHYGVAAALVQKFGIEACVGGPNADTGLLDQAKGVVALALELEQPICFRDELVYYQAPNWPQN